MFRLNSEMSCSSLLQKVNIFSLESWFIKNIYFNNIILGAFERLWKPIKIVPSVRKPEKIGERINRFWLNLILKEFKENCRAISVFMQIGPPYMKTYLTASRTQVARHLLGRNMFWMKTSEKNRTNFLCPVHFSHKPCYFWDNYTQVKEQSITITLCYLS